MAAVGKGSTVINSVYDDEQPFVVPTTVTVSKLSGVTITVLPVVVFKIEEGDHT